MNPLMPLFETNPTPETSGPHPEKEDER